MYVKLPVSTVGTTKKATGRVPTRIGRRGRSIIPQSTDVGLVEEGLEHIV